jgi:cytochrome P450 StaP
LIRFDPSAVFGAPDPYPIYAQFQASDPVHWGVSGLAGYPGAWYVFGYADAATVLRDPRFGKARQKVTRSDAPPVPEAALPFFNTARQWIVHRDPPDHTRLRGVLRSAFSPAAVDRLRPRITEIAHELLDEVEPDGVLDVIADYAFPLPVAVIAEMLGVPDAEGRALLAECSQHLQAVDLLTTEETWRRAGDAIKQTLEYLGGIVADRRRSPRDDLTSLMVAAHNAGTVVSDDELVANLLFLFVAGAGFQTTTGLIGSGVHLVFTHPDQRERLVADPTLIGRAVDEFLRYEPPIQMTNRTALADVELGGQTISAGDSVIAVLAAANRDSSVFPEPDLLDITRANGKQQRAFGLGIHTCLGGTLAAAEGEIAIDVLLRRHPKLRPTGPAEWLPAASIRVLRTLPAAF